MRAIIASQKVLKWRAVLGGALIFPISYTARRKENQLWAKDLRKDGNFFGFKPFTQDLFIPPVLTALPFGTLLPTPQAIFARGPIAPTGDPDDIAHGIAPEFGLCDDWNRFSNRTHEKECRLIAEEIAQRFVPGGRDTGIVTGTYRYAAAD